jgi:acyl-CoA hydrolase
MNRTTAQEAILAVRDGLRVFIGSGAAVPLGLLDAFAARARQYRDVEVCQLLTLGPAPYVAPELEGHVRHNAFFVGLNTRAAVQAGRADFTPVFLSEIPSLLRTELPIDVALVQVSPPDAHGFCSLGVSVDIVKDAVDVARVVIAEVNPRMPRTHGDSFVHVSRLAAVVDVDHELPELMPEPIDDVARAIGANVASLIGDGDTIQTGIGAIPNAVLAALRDRRDLGVHTEMFSDGVVDLVERGVITNARKTHRRGKLVTSFVMGTKRLYDFVDDHSIVEMRGSNDVNDPAVVARNRGMVAINSALAVDLTGQVCADSIGSLIYSGVGGQVDFIRGAARAERGKPVLALPATAKGGTISRIVAELAAGSGVTTSRADVHWIATEYGVVNLHGKTLRERARMLIQLAAPKFRDELAAAARARHLV